MEKMGGINRIVDKTSLNPDLLRERLQEQREREQKAGGKESEKSRLSELQKIILRLCVNNPPTYDATLDQILDAYFGKNIQNGRGGQHGLHYYTRMQQWPGLQIVCHTLTFQAARNGRITR